MQRNGIPPACSMNAPSATGFLSKNTVRPIPSFMQFTVYYFTPRLSSCSVSCGAKRSRGPAKKEEEKSFNAWRRLNSTIEWGCPFPITPLTIAVHSGLAIIMLFVSCWKRILSFSPTRIYLSLIPTTSMLKKRNMYIKAWGCLIPFWMRRPQNN